MLRVSQEAVEVVRKPTTAKLRISTYAAEVLCRPAAPHVHASQLAVEILRANAAVSSGNDQQPLVIVVAG